MKNSWIKSIGAWIEEHGFVLIVAIWFAWLLLGIGFATCSESMARAGVFGDWFGALNALFTGAALIGLIVNLQHAKLERTDQLAEIQRQVAIHSEEKVADRFVLLLNEYVAIAKAIGISRLVRLERELVNGKLGPSGHNYRDPHNDDHVRDKFDEFYEDHGAEIGHLLRMQVEIIRLIDERFGKGDDNERQLMGRGRELMDTFRAVLSDPELHLLTYLGLSRFVPEGFSKLIDTYGLLDGLTYKPRKKTDSPAVQGNALPIDTLYRIIEIKRYPKTYNNWISRRPQPGI